MKAKLSILLIISLLVAFLVTSTIPATADSTAQLVYQTPTAQPDGRILYVVQAGDTCVRVALINGISIDDLRLLNNLDKNCALTVGKQLLLGKVTPVANAGTAPTPTPMPPTPTRKPGVGKLCVLLFHDENGNALREESEVFLPGGAASITDRSGKVSLTGTTPNDQKGLCFELPEGEYSISMAAPEGFNPTMNMTMPLKLAAGDQSVVDFGAQVSKQAATLPPTEGGKSPTLGILGLLLVLGGAGLAIYIRFMRR